jgi:hypothetical protein
MKLSECSRKYNILIIGVCLLYCCTNSVQPDKQLGPLSVSPDGRNLLTSDGKHFPWLGDTAWSIFDQSRREDTANDRSILRYFETRARQGFTVIQTHFLTNKVRGEIDEPNAYGHDPFVDGDFTRPLIVDGPDNDYWDYADYLIEQTADHGMYMAIVAAWSNSFHTDEHPFVRDPNVAYGYGYFVGNRYRMHNHIIWLLGGDPSKSDYRRADNPLRLAMTRALAEGIADGVAGSKDFDGNADYESVFMSYHPGGGGWSSAEHLHAEEWLDFNMIQTTSHYHFTNYQTVEDDYLRIPAKPTLESEVAYEYSRSLSRKEKLKEPDRRVEACDVRRGAYWSMLAGGFGFTYGHRNLIGWVRAGEPELKWGADRPWFESLDAQGATQMKYLRRLFESRAPLLRIPDQTLIVGDAGKEMNRIQAGRARDGSYVIVYSTNGRKLTLDLAKLSGEKLQAWWFNPRDGLVYDEHNRETNKPFAILANTDDQEFTPPSSGNRTDWLLVLDDAAKGYSLPGQH